MRWQYTSYALPLLASAALSAALAVYAWRRRATPGATAFALQMAGAAAWALAYTLELCGADLATKVLSARLRYPAIGVTVLAWLAVALQFSRRERWLTLRNVVLAALLPAATVAVVATNEQHRLMWTAMDLDPNGLSMITVHGPWFWVNLAYTYFLIIAGTALVVGQGLRAPRWQRAQVAVLVASVSVPWLASVVHVSGITAEWLDPTPFALTLSGVGFAWGLFRFGLLDIVPVARSAVTEAMGDALIVLDPEDRIADLNAAARVLVGAPGGEARGRRVGDVLRDWPEVVACLRDRPLGRTEVRMGSGEGRRDFELVISPLSDPRGRPRGRTVVWRDVTARRRDQEELLAQKQRLERLAWRQTMLYEVLRTVGSRLSADEAAQAAVASIARFTSWPNVLLAAPDERGRWTMRASTRAFSVRQEVPPQGVIARAFTSGATQNVPDVARDPDYVPDHPAIRSELAVPLRRGQRVIGVLNLESDRVDAFGAEDVRLAESLAEAVALALDNARLYQQTAVEHARVQALLEASRDGVVLVGLDRRLLVVNEPALGLLQVAGGAEAWVGRPAEELLAQLSADASDAASALGAELRRAERGDEPPAEGECVVGPRVLRWVHLPVARGQAPLGRLLVLRDVTEERLLARMREDLTDTLVHDLRNPLTAIAGALELLEASTEVPASLREVVRIARAGSERMFTLVNGILDLSRLETGSMPLAPVRLALRPAVEEILASQRPLLRDRRVQLRTEVPADLPAAWADATLIGRVLQNLVGNAVKFVGDPGTVTVSALRHHRDPALLEVGVADDGPGIDPALQARLFQKFVTGQQQGHGSGVGLAFCRLAVEAHGGRIWVESAPGRGTVFRFTLPAAAADPVRPLPVRPPAPLAPEG